MFPRKVYIAPSKLWPSWQDPILWHISDYPQGGGATIRPSHQAGAKKISGLKAEKNPQRFPFANNKAALWTLKKISQNATNSRCEKKSFFQFACGVWGLTMTKICLPFPKRHCVSVRQGRGGVGAEVLTTPFSVEHSDIFPRKHLQGNTQECHASNNFPRSVAKFPEGVTTSQGGSKPLWCHYSAPANSNFGVI